MSGFLHIPGSGKSLSVDPTTRFLCHDRQKKSDSTRTYRFVQIRCSGDPPEERPGRESVPSTTHRHRLRTHNFPAAIDEGKRLSWPSPQTISRVAGCNSSTTSARILLDRFMGSLQDLQTTAIVHLERFPLTRICGSLDQNKGSQKKGMNPLRNWVDAWRGPIWKANSAVLSLRGAGKRKRCAGERYAAST